MNLDRVMAWMKNSEHPNRMFVMRIAQQRLFRVDFILCLIRSLMTVTKLAKIHMKKRQRAARRKKMRTTSSIETVNHTK